VTARRALPLALPALAAAIVLAAAIAAAGASDSIDAFERAAGVLAATGIAAVAVLARPAWTLSMAIVLSAFSSHWDDLGSPLPLDRIALGLGIFSVLAREWRHRDGRLQTRPIDWMLILVSLYALVSATIAGTIDEEHARFTLLDRYGLLPFLMFFVAPFAFRTEEDRRILLGVLVGLGAYLGVTAILETTGPKSLIVPSYITDPSIGIHQDRARGPFAEAAGNGVTMYFCAVAAAIAFVKWKDRRWRTVAAGVVALCLLGVVLSLTRAVWLGAAVGSPLALLAGRETRRYLVPAILVAFVLVIAAFATIPGLQHRVQKRTDSKQPLWDRRNSNAAAVRMVEARPLVGFGWGRFSKDSFEYYKQGPDFPLTGVRDLHNVFLSNAVELGLIGAGLWALAYLAAIGGAIAKRGPPELRPWKIGLLACALGLAVAWSTAPSAYVLPTLLLFAWAGIAWGGREETPTARSA
jgi:O-antigen ligase